MSGTPVITLTPIKNLNLLSYNPRTITTEAMDKLCKSLREDPDFLRNRPVLVNRVDGVLNVYAGTQRVRAAKKLKWKEVPCIVEENLSDDLIKVRMNKDNLHSGEFDWDILGNEFELEDLFAAGFDAEDLDLPSSLDDDQQEKPEKECEKCDSCGQKIKKKKNS